MVGFPIQAPLLATGIGLESFRVSTSGKCATIDNRNSRQTILWITKTI